MKRSIVTLLVSIALGLLAIESRADEKVHSWPEIANQDFYNHTYNCGTTTVILKNGQYRERGNICKEFWWLAHLDYADIDRDDDQEAIVSIQSYPCGSVMWTDDIFIFKIIKGQLHQIGQIWRERLESISVIDSSLVIVSPFWADNDPHCCPSKKESAVFVLKNGKLEKVTSTFTVMKNK